MARRPRFIRLIVSSLTHKFGDIEHVGTLALSDHSESGKRSSHCRDDSLSTQSSRVPTFSAAADEKSSIPRITSVSSSMMRGVSAFQRFFTSLGAYSEERQRRNEPDPKGRAQNRYGSLPYLRTRYVFVGKVVGVYTMLAQRWA